MSGSHRIWVGNMMFGASRSMIGTALSLLRVQATEVVWLRRGQSSDTRDCAAVLVFSSLEEASRALDGLNGVHAPFASSLSGGRLVARWANQRAGSQGSESRAMGSASDAAGQIRPSVAPRMQTRQGEDAHGKGRPSTPRPSVSTLWRTMPIDAFGDGVPTWTRSPRCKSQSPWSAITPATPSPVVSDAAPTELYLYDNKCENNYR